MSNDQLYKQSQLIIRELILQTVFNLISVDTSVSCRIISSLFPLDLFIKFDIILGVSNSRTRAIAAHKIFIVDPDSSVFSLKRVFITNQFRGIIS